MKTLYLIIAGMLLFSVAAYAQDENKTVSKFDFIPGEKIIFYDDFTTGNVGDFPAAWNTNSSGEIVTIAKYPGRWLQLTKGGFFIPEAKGTFTDNFTIEFDFVPVTSNNSENMYGIDFFLVSGTLDNPNEGGAIPGKAGTKITAGYDQIDWTNYSQKDEGYKDHGNSMFQFKSGQKYHIAFWVQKQRLRMYANENKVLDLPRGMIAGYSYNIFRMETIDDVSPIISNFRIAVGLPDMRNKLLNEGKLISYGIQFDVNSAKIKPESFATLKEIAQILTDNPSVKIKIVGHTDADGNDAANLDLSKRRAASVKTELNHTFSIDIARMETDGMGKTQPIAPNDNAVNKAKNRRVEFIKL
ncbi:OmpA family protein [uncultured Mucilaginibacter sp.]|uniref:OmpA family protein n=1 Tax=uncultured Mucilaginibacter sp. TaxID=797541 RepID=UPI0025FF95EA|nr:OmpA family protein [uncultured Mucilaginibacter sp.]